MKKSPPFLLWIMPVLSGLVFFALWYVTKAALNASDWLLPTPVQILQAAWQEKARLFSAALSTAGGALGGFVLATSIGFASALVLALSRKLHAGLYPWLLVLQM